MLVFANRPALVIVDMQNDFVRVGAPMEVPSARAILPNLVRILTAFRAAGLPVVFTRYVAAPNYRHLQPKLSWLKLIEAPVNACVRGHRRHYDDLDDERDVADVVDELAPEAHDIVVDKIYFSGFHETNLHGRLRTAGVDALVMTGTLTEMCVEDTARHAVHYAYPTAMICDSVASNVPDAQAATLKAFGDNYGWVMDCATACAAIATRTAAAEKG